MNVEVEVQIYDRNLIVISICRILNKDYSRDLKNDILLLILNLNSKEKVLRRICKDYEINKVDLKVL